MKPLEIEDIVTHLPFYIGKGMGFEWNRFISKYYDKDVVDFDVWLPTKGMNLQRQLCWTLEQKQQLILSMIKGIPIPKVSIIKYYGDVKDSFAPYKIEVIDGKQRINAYKDYINNVFALPTGHYFKDCSDKLKRHLYGIITTCDEATAYFGETISDEAKIAWFEQINFAGTPQDIEHLNQLKQTEKV